MRHELLDHIENAVLEDYVVLDHEHDAAWAAGERGRKKHFACFVVGNCGEVMDSAVRMAFFQLLR